MISLALHGLHLPSPLSSGLLSVFCLAATWRFAQNQAAAGTAENGIREFDLELSISAAAAAALRGVDAVDTQASIARGCDTGWRGRGAPVAYT